MRSTVTWQTFRWHQEKSYLSEKPLTPIQFAGYPRQSKPVGVSQQDIIQEQNNEHSFRKG